MEIKQIIANNIIELRKNKHWTQAELAERLNFTDKAVSKWERGESTPDVDTLFNMAKLFNVSVDYFFYEQKEERLPYIKKNNHEWLKSFLISILFCLSIFLISVVIFVSSYYKNSTSVNKMWIAFIYAVPLCSLIWLRYFHRYKNKFGVLITRSVLLWSTIATAYFQVLISYANVWMIFLIGAPIEGAIVIFYFLKDR